MNDEVMVMDGSSWRRLPLILWSLFLMGLLASGTILASIHWLTNRLDQEALGASFTLTDLFVDETLDQLVNVTGDFAHWQTAYDVVQDRDAEAAYSNIGISAVESDLFSQVHFFDANGDVIYSFGEEAGPFGAPDPTISAVAGPAIAFLQGTDPSMYEVTSGFVTIDGVPAAIAVAWIMPDDIAQLDPTALPFLGGVTLMNESWMADMAKHTIQSGYRFVTEVSQIPSGAPSLALPGFGGQAVGYLTWDQPMTGSRQRADIYPIILGICGLILASCFGAGRFFIVQHNRLQSLQQIASKDELTGVLNRGGLLAAVTAPKVKTAIAAGQAAAIYFDLNAFKQLNDDKGHGAGDMALQIIAERLKASVRGVDIVGRLGGDEFICVIVGKDAEAGARRVVIRFQEQSRKQIQFDAFSQKVQAAMGVAVAKPGHNWAILLEEADAAMYWAKRNGQEGAAFFTEGMGRRSEHIPSPQTAAE